MASRNSRPPKKELISSSSMLRVLGFEERDGKWFLSSAKDVEAPAERADAWMMGNPYFPSPSSSLTREFQQKCPRQQQRKTKKPAFSMQLQCVTMQIPWQFFNGSKPFATPTNRGWQSACGISIPHEYPQFWREDFFDLRKTAFKCIHKSELSKYEYLGKIDNISQGFGYVYIFPRIFGFFCFLL